MGNEYKYENAITGEGVYSGSIGYTAKSASEYPSMEEQIRRIVREEIAAHKEQLFEESYQFDVKKMGNANLVIRIAGSDNQGDTPEVIAPIERMERHICPEKLTKACVDNLHLRTP